MSERPYIETDWTVNTTEFLVEQLAFDRSPMPMFSGIEKTEMRAELRRRGIDPDHAVDELRKPRRRRRA